jgi:hypothetical protein
MSLKYFWREWQLVCLWPLLTPRVLYLAEQVLYEENETAFVALAELCSHTIVTFDS